MASWELGLGPAGSQGGLSMGDLGSPPNMDHPLHVHHGPSPFPSRTPLPPISPLQHPPPGLSAYHPGQVPGMGRGPGPAHPAIPQVPHAQGVGIPHPHAQPLHVPHSHQHPLQHQPPVFHPGLRLPNQSPLPGPAGPPVPHTPVGTPGNPFTNGPGPGGPEHDLPHQLLELGWRKFWSKRENRWYFWNCNTSESLWEVPQIPGRHPHPPHPGQNAYDPITDPFGIQHGSIHAGMKRRSSSGEHMGSPTIKKFILAGPWDLEIGSNVFVATAPTPQSHLLPPHPAAELFRYQLVAKLRSSFQTACKSREQIDAPKDSLNRWLLEQKIKDLKGIDPLFPSCDSAEGILSPVLFKEIMNDVPMKILKPRFPGDARKQLAKFAEACKKAIETRSVSSEARKLVKWKAEETFTWLREVVGSSFEAIQERLAHLKETCQPHVQEAAKSSVEGISRKVSALAKQYAQQSYDTHLGYFVDPQNVKKVYDVEMGRFRCSAAICGPYQFTEKYPTIEYVQQDTHALLKFDNQPVRISTQYLQKLEQLYRYNCPDDKKFEFFLARSYCLLKRYNAYSEEYKLCQSTQGSLPVPVFESIQRNFGVTFECFSSPLNCYFRQYCSAFPDTDGYFGSRGTFLDFHPVSGSFELNPPFSEDLIDASITHVEELLAGTREAMSFIVFVPEYEDREGLAEFECLWLKRLETSRWKRKQITLPSFEHEYRNAAQHAVSKSEISVRAAHATVVFWLQNEAGFEEWKPTDHKVDSLIDAYRPGRERERDRQDLLSPERQNPHQADKAVAAAAAAAATTVVQTSA